MKCAVVTTTSPDITAALDGVIQRFSDRLGGARPDLLMVYFTPHHAHDAPMIRERLMEQLAPRVLLGCPAIGVIGESVEVEAGAGLSLWGATWPGAELQTFHLSMGDADVPEVTGWADSLPQGAGLMLLADPYTTPPEDLLNGLHERYPDSPVVGGMASGSSGPGAANIISHEGIHNEGALVVAISGTVRMDTVVSQGCRPVGSHLVITKANRNAILSLGGKPALSALQAVASEVSPEEQDLMRSSLHVGRVVDERKSQFERGDFLVRNVLGVDPETQGLLVSDLVRAGQTIQFMVRDAEAAGEELGALLDREAAASKTLGQPLGAMLFSCNGRGSKLFGRPHHDVGHVHASLGELPTAGFFAAGEIGPVGGQPFLHGFTASIALFREQAARA